MTENPNITCRLYLPEKHYKELKNDIKEIFIKAKGSRMYYTDFPAGFDGGDFVNYITAFVEVCLIMGNDRYEVDEGTDVSCEVFKLGENEKHFSLLVTINYPGVDQDFHEMLTFNKLEEKDDFFAFELLGDQTMFAMDAMDEE